MAHRIQRLDIFGMIRLLAACGDDVSEIGTEGSSSGTGVTTSEPGSTSLPTDTTTGMSGNDDVHVFDVTGGVLPYGDVAGVDGVYAIDIAVQVVVDTIALAPATNSNALAVRPQAVTCVP